MTKQLTDEQQALWDKMTVKQRACVQERMKDALAPNSEIYKRAMRTLGDTDFNEEYANRRGWYMMSLPVVEEFLKTFEIETISDMVMGRVKMLMDLTDIAQTNIEDVVDITHSTDQMMDVATGKIYQGVESVTVRKMDDIPPHARKSIKSIEPTRYGLKVTLHDQLHARKLIADLQGYNAPIKQEIKQEEVKSLDDFYGNSES